MANFALFWPVDLSGYELYRLKRRGTGKRIVAPRFVHPGKTVARSGSGGSAAKKIRSGDDVVQQIRERRQVKPEHRNIFKIDGLIYCLAEMACGPRPLNAEGALDFVTNFGFLEKVHGPESVESIVHHIEVAQSIVKCIEGKDWPTLQAWALDSGGAIKLHPSFVYHEDDDWSEMFVGPERLIDAIYLQALDEVATGAEFDRCDNPGCGKRFRVGPGTWKWRVKRDEKRKRRFCSPKCQKQFAYRLKKGEVT